jgi:hypothetical protein
MTAAPLGRARAQPLDAEPWVVHDETPVPDGMVLLPREVAEAAYAVLRAISVLKPNGGAALFAELGQALDKAPNPPTATPRACADCAVQVHYGLPHEPSCASPDALRLGAAAIPGLAPADE